MVVKIKMTGTSLVSRVKTTAGTGHNNSKKHCKNSKKTTRKTTSAFKRIFAKLDKLQRYTIEDELNIDAGKHVLVMYLN